MFSAFSQIPYLRATATSSDHFFLFAASRVSKFCRRLLRRYIKKLEFFHTSPHRTSCRATSCRHRPGCGLMSLVIVAFSQQEVLRYWTVWMKCVVSNKPDCDTIWDFHSKIACRVYIPNTSSLSSVLARTSRNPDYRHWHHTLARRAYLSPRILVKSGAT